LFVLVLCPTGAPPARDLAFALASLLVKPVYLTTYLLSLDPFDVPFVFFELILGIIALSFETPEAAFGCFPCCVSFNIDSPYSSLLNRDTR
jgi:hypothetical protein